MRSKIYVNLATMYEYVIGGLTSGLNVNVIDKNAAEKLYFDLVRMGNTDVMVYLAWSYLRQAKADSDVKKEKLAFELFEHTEKSGNYTGYYNIGHHLKDKISLEDKIAAIEYFFLTGKHFQVIVDEHIYTDDQNEGKNIIRLHIDTICTNMSDDDIFTMHCMNKETRDKLLLLEKTLTKFLKVKILIFRKNMSLALNIK